MDPHAPTITFVILVLGIVGIAQPDEAPDGAQTGTPKFEAVPAGERAAHQSSLPSVVSDDASVHPAPLGLLVFVDELRERLDQPNLRLLDVRPQREYDAGRIPGAVRVDVDDWTSQALSPGGLHDGAAWGTRVGTLGVTYDTNVVVYGGSNVTSTTRIWWTLKYLGVKHVGILDGGWSAWVERNGPISTDRAVVPIVPFHAEFQTDRLAEMEDVRLVLDDPTLRIVDARSQQEYTGTGGPGPRRGRIPGAVHQEWNEFVTRDGRFESVENIRGVLADAGLTPDQRHITHCQSGGRASLNAFAMELAGYKPVMNYYCGWSEWSPASDSPIESSAE